METSRRSSCDHSKNTGRPFFPPNEAVGKEGVKDMCIDEGRTGFAARRWCVDDNGITFFLGGGQPGMVRYRGTYG